PLEDLRGELVLAGHDRAGEVELRGREGVGGVADVGAVQPQRDRALGAVEGDREAFAGGERLVVGEGRDVGRDGVEPVRYLPWHDLVHAVPRVLRVRVLGAVVAVELDVGRDGDVVPFAGVEVGGFEPGNHTGEVLCVMELPDPVQRGDAAAVRDVGF